MNRLRTGLLGLFLSALVGPVIAAPKPVDWTHVSSRGFAVQQTSGKYILLKRLHVLRALDARTGKLKFETELRDELHGRAALIGKYMLRYELDQVVIHDIERGKVLQTFQKVEEFYPGDKYYFVQLSSKARAGYQPPHRKVMQNLKGLWPRMRGRTAEERARQQRIKVGQMMVYGDVGLTSLRCFDPKKGSVKWTIDLGFKSWKSRGAGKKTQRKHYNRLIALSGGTQGLLARVKTWLSNPERPLPKVPHGSTLKAEQAKHGAAEAAREGELLVFIAPRTGRKSPAVTVDRRASDGADPPTTQWITDGKKAYLVVRWKHKTLPKYRFRIYTTHGTLKHSLPPTAHDTVAFGKRRSFAAGCSSERSRFSRGLERGGPAA